MRSHLASIRKQNKTKQNTFSKTACYTQIIAVSNIALKLQEVISIAYDKWCTIRNEDC